MAHAEVREANRPAAPVPRELWVVIGLLVAAGGVMLYQTLPLIPDVVDFTFDASPFKSLGLFFVAYLLELAFLGVLLVGLAYRLYLGDPNARLTAAVVCGALGVSYVLQEHRADTENWEMLLVLLIAAILAVAPASRAWAAARADQSEPSPVNAAVAISAAMGAGLGLLGLSLLAATPVDRAFGLIGAGLCIGGVVLFRCLGGVRAGDVEARHLLSGLMVGYVVLLLLARVEASAAQALIVPITLAGAVVALIWFPPASQIHFGLHATDAAPAAAPVRPARAAPPAPAPPVVVPPVEPPAPAPRRRTPSPPVRPAAATVPAPTPAPRPQPARPVPVPPVKQPVPAVPAPAPAPPVARPAPLPVRAVSVPPVEHRPPVLAAPPPAAQTAFHAVVGVVAGSRMAKSSALQLMYDQQSWFPAPAPEERVLGAYLVLMLLHGEGGPRDRIFEGTSSLLISDRRLAGVCPKGAGRQGPLDSTRGPVIPWSVPFDELSEATTATSRSGTYLAMTVSGRSGSRILLAKPKIVRAGSFVPVDVAQLARDLTRGRRAWAPAREMVTR